MKRLFCIFIFVVGMVTYSLSGHCTGVLQNADTSIAGDPDKIIDEVIESKAPPAKEKIVYISQVTHYGFKDLFKNYSYNSSMPYAAQVSPFAENYMEDYLNAHKNFLLRLKDRSLSYFNFIDGILSQYGLPTELKYLAVIESNLNSNALSVAGARGPWQFMSYTARDFGLQVNQVIDERTDFFKSTNAAAKYLLSLYKDLNDWLLVIAAYNGGPGRVYSAIRKSGSRNFWKLQYYLPEESRNHVKKFIATHYVMENDVSGTNGFNYSKLSSAKDLSVPALSDAENTTLETFEISGRYNAAIIARNIEMPIKEFNRLNPQFDNMMSMGANYTLRLPQDKMDLFKTNKFIILNQCVEQLLGNIDVSNKTVYGRKN